MYKISVNNNDFAYVSDEEILFRVLEYFAQKDFTAKTIRVTKE